MKVYYIWYTFILDIEVQVTYLICKYIGVKIQPSCYVHKEKDVIYSSMYL